MLLRLSKKENILIINKNNITKLTKAVFPEYNWVILLMVYAFHRVIVSSVRYLFLLMTNNILPSVIKLIYAYESYNVAGGNQS